MTHFWSYHLIVNRRFPDDSRDSRDFIDADFSHLEDPCTLFSKLSPSANANIFPHYFAYFGKMLNISSANDSSLTVLDSSCDGIVFKFL